MQEAIAQLDTKDCIIIKGAKVNNLKGVDVVIPRGRLVLITGLSGSGKSSLAFDTLFAEGQRMYVESLSAYARQFLGRMEKPAVEYIRGISPAIAVEQQGNSKNPRATVGTTTEVYDYLKLLFARVGETFSPISGEIVKKDRVSDVIDYTNQFEEGQRLQILAPLVIAEDRKLEEELKIIFQKGFSRLLIDEEVHFIEDLLEKLAKQQLPSTDNMFLLIDRGSVKPDDEDNQFRLADSVQTAFFEGHGDCLIEIVNKEKRWFSDRFEADGQLFEEPSVQFFSFNSPYGACKNCNGFGNLLDIDEDLVIPDPELSVHEGAVLPWQTEKMSVWRKDFCRKAVHYDFPVHRSYKHLNEKEKQLLWEGNTDLPAINQFFDYIKSKGHQIQYRVLLSRYRAKVTCKQCRGTKLRADAQYVKLAQQSITDLVLMPLDKLLGFVREALPQALRESQQKVAERLLVEIEKRLSYLCEVGLGYLTLNRLTSSLSGGEYQRIKLATALGSALVGSMYILDEPSIGLHPRDTKRLVKVMQDLRDLGNTVIVVEHEEEVMRAADYVIDIGPQAGSQGGELLFCLSQEELKQAQAQTPFSWINPAYPIEQSHTHRFLNGLDSLPTPKKRRNWHHRVTLHGASEHNLKSIDAEIPLEVLTVVTGVSGSGKSTLIKNILLPHLQRYLGQKSEKVGRLGSLEVPEGVLEGVEFVDQNPIGRSSRSNPATYTKVYDYIRNLYAEQNLSKQRSYTASHFSFNSEQGRCETCQGDGKIKIEMQFMADIYLTCESCKGKRFKKEILEVKYREKDIADILDMTVQDCLQFFEKEKRVKQALQPLLDVGLSYVTLGQPTSTLSGGESQRLKLATFLKEKQGQRLYIFDEPTTGLHFQDIKQLMQALNALVEQGNSVLIIEHNLEVIRQADWIIDLGPEAGENGGQICFAGKPEDLVKESSNHTASFLKSKL